MGVTEDDVSWCYQTLLGREPESPKIVQNKVSSEKDFRSLLLGFIDSEEYRLRVAQPALVPLERARMEVDVKATPNELALLKDRIRETWSQLGIDRPHDSVLAGADYQPDNINDKAIERFYETGVAEADIVFAILKRCGFRDAASKVCVENGCGLGRVTLALAKRFKKVHGYDISPNHLKRAEEYAIKRGVKNVVFHQSSVASVEDKFEECDFFYSRLVLQHNPPPLMRELIVSSLKALRPNGVAIFQVPTYGVGYSFRIKEYIARPRGREIEMHCLPQPEVFSIIAEAGCSLIEVAQDNAIGQYSEWVSDTFVVQRPAAGSKRAAS